MIRTTNVANFDFESSVDILSWCQDNGKYRPARNFEKILCGCRFSSYARLLLAAYIKHLMKTDGNSTKVRFILFPQCCFLRNIADLLDFLLHRVLSKASVQNMRCHNTIPPRLRSELTCSSVQLYIWRLDL